MRYVAFDIETAPTDVALSREMVKVAVAEKIRDELAAGEVLTATEIVRRIDEADLSGFKIGRRNQLASLLKFFEANIAAYVKKVSKACGLDPLRGRIISAAFYFHSEETGPQSDVICIADANRGINSEADLIRWIWQIAALFDGVITFNGHGFDVPFLQKRSAILGVMPTIDLCCPRYKYRPNCDLMQWIANWETHKYPSLVGACEAFGIPFDKGGMTGADVAEYAEDNRWEEIKAYNMGDVKNSLWPLYIKCRDHIPGHADPERIRKARADALKDRNASNGNGKGGQE